MTATAIGRILIKVLSRLLPAIAVVIVLLCAGLSAWLATPAASRRISLILSDVLRQPTRISGLHLSLTGLRVTGLAVANPSGFSSGTLLSVRSLTVNPVWSAVARGEKRFRTIEVDGVRLVLEKNGSGEWNFNRFSHLWAGKKPAATETFIRRLAVSDTAISVNGRSLDNLALVIADLATRGSMESGISLDCKDAGGSPFHLEGKGRLGAAPAASLTLRAPAVSLDAYARYLKHGSPLQLAGGRGSVELDASLDGERAALRCALDVDRVHLLAKGERLPLRASLLVKAGYDAGSDAATLDEAVARIDDAVRLRATGRVKGVKSGERRFVADLALDTLELGDLLPLLPGGIGRDLGLKGRIGDAGLHLSGDGGRGITAGEGRLRLTGGEVQRKGVLICNGLAADLRLARSNDGWAVTGTAERRGSGGEPLVGNLSLPLSLRLSRKMGLLAADIDPFSARLSGLPIIGEFHLDPAAPTPCRLRVVVPETGLARLQQFVPEVKAVLGAGTAAAEVTAAGRSIGDLAGRGTVRLTGVALKSGGRSIALAKGKVTADFAGIARTAAVTGSLTLDGGSVDGKHFAAASAFSLRDGAFTLQNGTANIERLALGFSSVGGTLPRADASGRLPIALSIAGLRVQQGDVFMSGGGGSINLTRLKEGSASWLAGGGTFGVNEVSCKGTSLGPCSLRLNLDRGTGVATLTASPFGGHLEGTVSADPADMGKGIGFSVKFAGFEGAGLDRLAGRREGWHLAGGRVGGNAAGTYSGAKGVSAAGELAGDALTVAAPGGKTAVAGAGLRLQAKVAGPDLTVQRCLLTTSGMSVGLHGELARYAAADRKGSFSIEMSATPISAILDDFVNLLPMSLQEASAGGTAAFRSKVQFNGKTVTAAGALDLGNASLDIPTHKLAVSGIRGTIPFSVATAGAHLPARRDILTFSRDNFPQLLTSVAKGTRGGQQLVIDRMKFSVMEIAGARFAFRAGDGVTEIEEAEIPFSGGMIRGSGAFVVRNGPVYDANLLISDVSLRELCSSFAAIKGYISGKVDGIVSLRGEKGGVGGLKGFVDLWTRSGKSEKRLVSKEFLQKLAGKNLKGFFFRNDRPYDRGEITAYLDGGYLTFGVLDISHTNFFGIRDLSVSVAPVSNRITLDHLFLSIKQAAERGKAAKGGESPAETPVQTEFKWQE
jgi:uncharacterized protein DUF748